MSEIYSSASQVLVYLGEDADRSDLAVELIEKIVMISRSAYSEELQDLALLQGFGLPPSSDVAWKAFESFWRRP
jgi:hypothetical protein